jgi:ActR/RegA family two-component response regulator
VSKQVLIVEDDDGYGSLLRNIGESRGWDLAIGTELTEVAGAVDWADVAVIDLDAEKGEPALQVLRERRPELCVVALVGDEAATPESTGADAVVHELPGDLVDVVNRLTSPPSNVIDLSDSRGGDDDDRPWYVTR